MKKLFSINGRLEELELTGHETLLELLRSSGHTEVKCGCNEGECGACLVLMDEKPVNSCQVLAMSLRKEKIKTVKGIGTLYEPSVIQKTFAKAGADQCGFCSPGMIIASYSILKNNPEPSYEEITEGLDGNLCRCTGYVKIVEAVRQSAHILKNANTEAE